MKLLLVLALTTCAWTMQRVQVECSVGGKPVVTSGISSTTKVVASYPNCTINVFITGSGGTRATLFSTNTGTALSNPFTANAQGFGYFYTANSRVDVTISGGGPPSLPTPITFGDINVFDFPWTLPNPSGTGCWETTIAGQITLLPCAAPSGAAGAIQYTDGTNFQGDANFTWNSTVGLEVNKTATFNQPVVVNNLVESTFSQYNAFRSTVGGAQLPAYSVTPSALNSGGYTTFAPVLYNPYNSSTPCFDQWGNLVTQPLPLTGLSNFGSHAVVLWNSTSPVMPSNGSCGSTIPVELDYGLNTNGYFFGRGGFGTDQASFNSIHSLLGGVTALSFTAGGLYAAGTVTHCCGTLPGAQYIGGYIQVGHSATPPIADGNLHQTIAGYDNPLTNFGGLNQGTMYWDDTLNCLRIYNGSSWACSGGSSASAGLITQIQYSGGSGTFAASPNFTWDDGAHQLTVTGNVQSTVGFNSTGIATNTIQAANGGVSGKWLIGTDSLFLTEETTPAVSASGQARFYVDSTTHNLRVSANGAAYAAVGTGTPGGANTQIQFNNSGVFGGSANLTWSGTQLTITGSLQSTLGYNSTGVLTDTIQAINGGVTAKWLIANDSLFFLEEATPALSAAGQARVYAHTGDHHLFVSKNGAAYLRLATNSGAFTTGDCQAYDAAGNTVSAGGPCSVGGGGGTVSSAVATAVAYYPSTGTTVGGSSFFFWNNATRLLTVNTTAAAAGMAVVGGFMQADTGFLATTGVANNFNAFNAPTGGLAGKSGTFTNYVQVGNYATGVGVGPVATTADTFQPGAMSYSTASNCLSIFNGATWACISGAGGGVSSLNALTGALTLAGTANRVIVTPSGATITLSLPQDINTTAAVNFGTVTTTGAIQSTVAAGAAIGFQIGNGLGTPFQVNGNGAVSGAGVFASTGASGGFNVTTNTAANSIQSVGGINVGSGGSTSGVYESNGTIVINSSGIYLGPGVNTPGSVQSGLTGTNITFQNSNGLFAVDGNGALKATSYNVGAIPAINGSAQFVGTGGVLTTGNITGAIVASSGSTSAVTSIQAGRHYISVGTVPTTPTAGCFISAGSTDVKGEISCSTTGTTSPQVNFATVSATVATCTANERMGGTPLPVSPFGSTSNVQFIIQPTTSGTMIITYVCMR